MAWKTVGPPNASSKTNKWKTVVPSAGGTTGGWKSIQEAQEEDKFSSRAKSAYNKAAGSPLGKGVSAVLNLPSWMIGGGLRGATEELEGLKKQEQAAGIGPQPLEAIGAYGRGFAKGVPEGVRDKHTAFDYMTGEQTEFLPNKVRYPLAIGSEFKIPVAPITKLPGLLRKGKNVVQGTKGGAKALETIGKTRKAVGEIPAVSKTKDLLGENFVYRYGQPEEYKKVAEERLQSLSTGREQAEDVGKLLTKDLSKTDQQTVMKLMQGEDVAGASDELIDIAKRGREYIDPLSKELISESQKGGIKLGPEMMSKIEENVGTYMPNLNRFYEKDPENFIKMIYGGARSGVKPKYLTNKKVLTEAEKKFLDIIEEPGYGAAKRVTQMNETVANSKFFRYIDDNFASLEDISGTLEKLPESANLGPISGKFVPKHIAEELQPLLKTGKGDAEKLYMKTLSLWKQGKILWNPATRMRNQFSNMILMDTVGGVNPLDPTMWVKGAKEYLQKGKYYQEAKELGVLGKTYYAEDLARFIDNYNFETGNSLKRMAKSFNKNLGESYGAQEDWAKISMFQNLREAGTGADEAAKLVEKSLFDYTKLPKGIKKLKNSPFGFPFLTFTYKALPAVGEAAVKHPERFRKYAAAKNVVEGEAENKLGPEQAELLPDYMKEGMYIRLPYKDKNDRELYLDMNYVLPWGDVAELGSKSIGGVPVPRNPAFTLASELFSNKSLFTGQPIFDDVVDRDPDGSLSKEALKKLGNHAYRTLMPSWAPPVGLHEEGEEGGGYSTNKLFSALKGRPDYHGRLRDIPMTLADVLGGLKVTPVDMEMQKGFKQSEKRNKVQEIQREMGSDNRNQSFTPEEREKRNKRNMEKIQGLLKE